MASQPEESHEPQPPQSPASASTGALHNDGDGEDHDAAPPPQDIPDHRAGTATDSSPPPNTRRCFVCLVDEPESSLPPEWSTPCSCSLEGHQECLLDWLADLEARGKDLNCPVCKSKIRIVDRWDPAVGLADYLNALFSDWSPTILVSFLATGTIAGSAVYGLEAVEIFAGPEFARAILYRDVPENPLPPMIQRLSPLFSLDGGWALLSDLSSFKLTPLCALPLIGPALILNRFYFPGFPTIPVSLMVRLFPGI
jgi:hypothetical protein